MSSVAVVVVNRIELIEDEDGADDLVAAWPRCVGSQRSGYIPQTLPILLHPGMDIDRHWMDMGSTSDGEPCSGLRIGTAEIGKSLRSQFGKSGNVAFEVRWRGLAGFAGLGRIASSKIRNGHWFGILHRPSSLPVRSSWDLVHPLVWFILWDEAKTGPKKVLPNRQHFFKPLPLSHLRGKMLHFPFFRTENALENRSQTSRLIGTVNNSAYTSWKSRYPNCVVWSLSQNLGFPRLRCTLPSTHHLEISAG